MKHIELDKVDITEGFWSIRQDINKNITIKAVKDRFSDTGRFQAFDYSEENRAIPHIFYDSDVAKWIEGVAYTLEKERDEELETFIDHIVDSIEKNRSSDGYYNSHFLRVPTERWKHRGDHELYCAGHLMEAAVAYYRATGKRKLLDLMEDYAGYIRKVFIEEGSAAFKTPGHEEIELALVRMYDATGNKSYLELSKHFIDTRGSVEDILTSDNYNSLQIQDHLPLREQKTAQGHAVRAGYLYSAMADIAVRYNDVQLHNACKALFNDIINKKMYITGGVGTSNLSEAFTVDYDLPNRKGYAETCAAIALAYFAQRMILLDKDSVYADTVERIIYNGFLSGISLDGKAFFYENPLEIQPWLNRRNVSTALTERNPITQRKEVFSCSCCPPNVIRFISSINNYIYSTEGNTLFIHQHISSELNMDGVHAKIETEYPNNGNIMISIRGMRKAAIRVPYWCKDIKVILNGKKGSFISDRGYIYIDLQEKDNIIEVMMDMVPTLVYSNINVHENSNKCAVMRGPMVYCCEAVDNEFSLNGIRFTKDMKYTMRFRKEFNTNVLLLEVEIPNNHKDKLYDFILPEYKKAQLKMIPYFCFANRGETEMRVWL